MIWPRISYYILGYDHHVHDKINVQHSQILSTVGSPEETVKVETALIWARDIETGAIQIVFHQG